MKTGDRVRLLHSREEGVITRVSSGGRIEVEIEDGFRIPVMQNELVVISAVEKEYFGGAEPDEPSSITQNTINDVTEGIFLGLIPLNDKDHSLYFINSSKKDYAYSIDEIFGKDSRTLSAGLSDAKSNKKLGEKSIGNFEDWPPLRLRFIPVNRGIEETMSSFEREIKFKASNFGKGKKPIPLLDKTGYLIRIDSHEKPLDVKLLNKGLNEEEKAVDSLKQFPRPEKSVDLHIEKLTDEHKALSNSEKLRFQLEVFEKNLDAAIATGMDEISFIHGIGNGVLRKEIHKYLSQMDKIKYFQDTQKSQFGYGATLVRIS